MKKNNENNWFVLNKGMYIIEEANICGGNINKALKFLKKAKEVGADAVEFQFSIAKDFYIQSHRGFELFKKLEYRLEEIKIIIDTAHELGIHIVGAPLSHNLISKLVEFGVDAFNINGSDINNQQIIEKVCKTKKPFFISLILASETEVAWAVNKCMQFHSENFALLVGQHTMASGDNGVKPYDTNLGYINTLKKQYNKCVGFIDHSRGIYMPSIALASGADFITKHMTFSRADKGSDWFICLEPEEMKESIINFKSIRKSLSQVDKALAPGEQFDKSLMRRSIVAKIDLPAGHTIRLNDLCFKRPGDGISPSKYQKLIGKKVLVDIKTDEIIYLNKIAL